MSEGVYNKTYNFICKECKHKFKYHKLIRCPKCGSFGIKINNEMK